MVRAESPTTPAPYLIGAYDTPGSAFGVFVVGHTAYVADGVAGLQIIDVGDPAHPTKLGGYDTPGTALAVKVVGTRAYVADGRYGIQIIDISNPATPVKLGTYDTPGYAYALDVESDPASSPSGRTLFVADNTGGLLVLDVTDPGHPTLLASAETSGGAYDVRAAGGIAFVAIQEQGLELFDVTNRAAPSRLGGCVTGSTALGVQVEGGFAYVATYDAGIDVIDISNAANPVRVSNYDTKGYANSVWVTNGSVCVADAFAGILFLDAANPKAPYRLGEYDTPGTANKVQVVGRVAYVADGSKGLTIVGVPMLTPQQILFDGITDRVLGSEPIVLDAIATSDLPVSYILVSGPATLTDNVLRLIGTGRVAIRIEQPGDESFYPAASVEVSFNVLPMVPIREALDSPGLVWTNIGSAEWFGETDNAYDGVDAAVSGFIENVQQTGLSTTVHGPGQLAFWWKVSSEPEKDVLRFVQDGSPVLEISGTKAWALVVLTNIVSGEHTLSWIYSKDLAGAAGADCAWLDHVAFAGANDPPAIMEHPVSLTAPRGTPQALSVTAIGYELEYQWYRDDQPIAGATNQILRFGSLAASDTGDYSVSVYNTHGAVRSAASHVDALARRTASFLSRWAGDPDQDTRAVRITNGMAFLAEGPAGLSILNVNNPANPTRIGKSRTGGNAFGLTLVDGLVYLADGNAGLRVIDAHKPAVPTLLGTYKTSGPAQAVAIVGKRAYVAASTGGMDILDVSIPSSPSLVGRFSTQADYALEVLPAGRLVYLSNYMGGLVRVDVTDPANPIGTGGFHQVRGAQAAVLSPSGDALYLADNYGGVLILDPRADDNLRVIGADPTAVRAIHLCLDKGFALVAGWEYGLQILDVSVASHPIHVGGYGHGDYMADVQVANGKAFVAAAGRGMLVLNLVEPAPQTVTMAPIPDMAPSETPLRLHAEASTGGAIRYFVVSGPAVVAGDQLTLTGLGRVVVQAYQDGNDDVYPAASPEIGFNIIPTTSIGDAMNSAAQTWTQSADLGWFGETTTTHDGDAAATACLPPGRAAAVLKTTVTGPGELAFWWKSGDLAPRTTYSFLVDGKQYSVLAEETDWRRTSLSIPEGAHTLEWSLSGDGAGEGYIERVWLDQLTVVHVGERPVIADQPEGNTINGGCPATLSVGAVGRGLVYRWYHEGQFVATTSSGSLTIPAFTRSDAGGYSVTVSNSYGQAESTVSHWTWKPRTTAFRVGVWPATPAEAGDPGAVYAPGLCVSNRIACLACEHSGVYIIDVSDVTHPRSLGHYAGPGFPNPPINATRVRMANSHVFVADGTSGFQILDIADPRKPVRVGGFRLGGSIYDVLPMGGYLATANAELGILTYLVENPAAPLLSGTHYGVGVGTIMSLDAEGPTLVSADSTTGLQFFDAAQPEGAPLAVFQTPAPATALKVRNSIAYAGCGLAGVQLVEAGNPAHPKRVGQFSTAGYAWSIDVSGTLAVVAEGPFGIEVIDVSIPKQPVRIGGAATRWAALGVSLDGDHAYVTTAAGLEVFTLSSPSDQSLQVAPIPGRIELSQRVALDGTSGSGLPVSFRVVEGPAAISGTNLAFLRTGTVILRAEQAGNDAWYPAEPLTFSIEILPDTDPDARPRLTIEARDRDEGVRIAWPATAWRFDLESTPTLSPASSWQPVNGTISHDEDWFFIMVPKSPDANAPSAFYRLRRP